MNRRLACTLCLVLLLIILGLDLTVFAQKNSKSSISDSDKKEILARIFQQVLGPRPDGPTIIVFINASADKKLLPDLANVTFKQLSYEEEKTVADFYRLSISDTHKGYIDIDLAIGTYCKKQGYQYHVTGLSGKWKIQEKYYVESFTPVSKCPNCKLESIVASRDQGLSEPLRWSALNQINPLRKKKDFALEGEVASVKCARKDQDTVICDGLANMRFVNNGVRNVIVVKPFSDHILWLGATTLSLTLEDAQAENPAYVSSAWPNVYTSDEYKDLANRLDKPSPPADATVIIKPGESWEWKTSFYLGFNTENSCNSNGRVEMGWKEVVKRSQPFWLELAFEMWPFNVENFKADLGGQLRRRWQKSGVLYLEEKKEGRYWFASLESEPMMLDLTKVKLEDSNSKE